MATSNPNGVNLEQLLTALARKGIPLQFEMGTFVVLEATEKVLAMQAADRKQRPPAQVTPDEVWLSDEGELALGDVRAAASEREACTALVELLGSLLVRSAPGVPAMLLELVEHGPSDGEWSLRRLRDDLEASLLPLNRGATRRVLSRLLREMRRDVERGKGAAPAPDLHSVDRALDDLLGLEGVDAPPPIAAAPEPSSHGAAPALRGGTATDEAAADASTLAETVRPGPRVPMAGQIGGRAAHRDPARAEGARLPSLGEAERVARRPDARAPEPISVAGESSPAWSRPADIFGDTAPALRGGASSSGARSLGSELDEFDSRAAREGRGGNRTALLLVVGAVLLVGAYLLFGREQAQHALGIEQPAAAATKSPDPAAAPAPRYGELRVTSTPDRAQVLMLVGTGPALIKDLPVGVAHEFVAMADGLAPARGLVPPGATWTPEGGSPRYELAMQLSDASGGALDLGASRLTQATGTPTGALGSVRVVTSPPGARVYQLIGFTPDVRVQNLPVDAPVELLLFVSGYGLQRASVGPGDWKPEAGGLVATVDVTLTRKGH